MNLLVFFCFFHELPMSVSRALRTLHDNNNNPEQAQQQEFETDQNTYEEVTSFEQLSQSRFAYTLQAASDAAK